METEAGADPGTWAGPRRGCRVDARAAAVGLRLLSADSDFWVPLSCKRLAPAGTRKGKKQVASQPIISKAARCAESPVEIQILTD